MGFVLYPTDPYSALQSICLNHEPMFTWVLDSLLYIYIDISISTVYTSITYRKMGGAPTKQKKTTTIYLSYKSHLVFPISKR